MDEQKEYLLKEFDKLNNEVGNLLQETRTREKFSLTITAAVAAWIYTEVIKFSTDPLSSKEALVSFLAYIKLLSYVPLVTTLLYAVSVYLIYKNIKWIGDYLFLIEKTFIGDLKSSDGEIFGWEKYFKKKKTSFISWTWAIWVLQIIIAIAIIWITYQIV